MQYYFSDMFPPDDWDARLTHTFVILGKKRLLQFTRKELAKALNRSVKNLNRDFFDLASGYSIKGSGVVIGKLPNKPIYQLNPYAIWPGYKGQSLWQEAHIMSWFGNLPYPTRSDKSLYDEIIRELKRDGGYRDSVLRAICGTGKLYKGVLLSIKNRAGKTGREPSFREWRKNPPSEYKIIGG